jgi:hypothetical protein
MTTYTKTYSKFLDWYGAFFGGENGLFSISNTQVMDGQEAVNAFTVDILGQGNTFAVGSFSGSSGIIGQFESIAEWITIKFGGVILQNSCSLCQMQGGMVNNTPATVPSTSGSE